MQESDLEEVCSIEQKTFSIPWSKQAFRDSLDLYHTLFLVAELDGQVAGYCGCYLSLEEAEITNMAVREDLRGRGIAGEMLNQLMELGRRQGAFAYTLEVRVSNLTAIHLYENLGFETVGVRKNFYEKPTEDAMIMWRRWQ
jgi:ribosomal-protein-alanine N-acetyltransferase